MIETSNGRCLIGEKSDDKSVDILADESFKDISEAISWFFIWIIMERNHEKNSVEDSIILSVQNLLILHHLDDDAQIGGPLLLFNF